MYACGKFDWHGTLTPLSEGAGLWGAPVHLSIAALLPFLVLTVSHKFTQQGGSAAQAGFAVRVGLGAVALEGLGLI